MNQEKREEINMDLTGAYQEIDKRLSRIDFPLLFRGFHRFPFALYDETRACFDGTMIDKPAEFLGNTSVLFRGMHTAIWNLTEHTMDFDTLTAKIVHEMHANLYRYDRLFSGIRNEIRNDEVFRNTLSSSRSRKAEG